MSLPSSVGIPQEMKSGLDYSLPDSAKSFSIKIQPSNISQVVVSPAINIGVAAAGDISIPSQSIIFDLVCGGNSQFLDTRLTTLNFTVTSSWTAAGTGTFNDTYLRSGAYAWFDRLTVLSQSGAVLEDITEYALINDTCVALQMNNSVRHGVATQYGFDTNNYAVLGSQGHALSTLTGATPGAATETHSYSIPLLSGIVGVLNDKMLNVGRTSRIQVVLQTTNILPYTISASAAATLSPTFTLSNMSLQCEYIDIGAQALSLLDQTLVDGKMYSHGTSWRTTTASLPNVTGLTSLLAGVRASSVKSLFARFVPQGAAATTNSLHGKFNSMSPAINSIAWSIGGLYYPQNKLNPLLMPSQTFAETQKAIGSFNSAAFQSSIPPAMYCRLAAGCTARARTGGSTQEYNWNTPADVAEAVTTQSQFIYGQNIEVCPKRGLLSGLNCTSAPIFLEVGSAVAPTNASNVYVQAMLDIIIIHNISSGDISVRM